MCFSQALYKADNLDYYQSWLFEEAVLDSFIKLLGSLRIKGIAAVMKLRIKSFPTPWRDLGR